MKRPPVFLQNGESCLSTMVLTISVKEFRLTWGPLNVGFTALHFVRFVFLRLRASNTESCFKHDFVTLFN